MDGYFYGWYFKCQSENQTIAIIPAVHGAGRERTCSIQFITEENAWTVDFPIAKFYQRKDKIIVDNNHFGNSGIYLDITTSEIKVKGELFFSNITQISYDIMGPFICIPFMECYHSVYSIRHRVDGKLCINGKEYVFGHQHHPFSPEYAADGQRVLDFFIFSCIIKAKPVKR